VHMDTSAPITFGFLIFFEISHFCVFKNYVVKYVDKFRHEECTQKKFPLRNTLYFRKYKKDTFLYFIKYKVFLTQLF
jgi:hypothetical protein